MYNEERGAKKCVDAVMPVISKLSVPAALIVVNDGSKDKTKTILSQLEKSYPKNFYVVHHPKNKGYGGGLQTGITEAIKRKFEFCLFMDSDLTNDPKFIPDFVNAMRDDIDVVKASRYSLGGKMDGVPWYRQLISRSGNMIAAPMFHVGVSDVTNGFRMVRLSLLKDIAFKENNFSIIMEEMYYLKKKHARFAEIPNVLTSRTDTKTSFRYRPGTFWDYAKYPLKALVA